jgi:cell division FtsZ-interacting protein ZapD
VKNVKIEFSRFGSLCFTLPTFFFFYKQQQKMASNAACCQERNVDPTSRCTVLVLALMDQITDGWNERMTMVNEFDNDQGI